MEKKVFVIEDELKKLPESPGVYLMHNALDEIIYVGKAVILKNRVRQYFRSSRGKSPKIQQMVKNISWFEYIVTDSEEEALLLECNLIKKYRPRYNTMMTDDRGYQLIEVTTSEDFPRIFSVFREAGEEKKSRNRYFGPFTSGYAVKQTVELLHEMYPIRTCKMHLPTTKKVRPCLNYDIGRCKAPCAGRISKEEYGANIEEAIRFLSGDNKSVLSSLREKMKVASEMQDYESAISYRDLMGSVMMLSEKQKMTDAESSENRDVIGLAHEGEDAIIQVFSMRNGQLSGREHYHMTLQDTEEPENILADFVKQYYSGTPFIPSEIHLETEISEQELIERMLSGKAGHKVSVVTPKKGDKAHLLNLAIENAKMVLERDKDKISREEERTTGALSDLGNILGLSDLHRVEAFDISNISGFESVGSMVVFEDGKPRKNDYRKFRIKTVSGPDDYRSMEEVLTRRFRHGLEKEDDGFSRFPDVILMDGGKGQVHVAEEVLRNLQLEIPVAGMVKDDHHRTRGLYFHDTELPIDTHSEMFHLITRVQDEAHRFAITYHRGLHTKGQIQSVLRSIPGVGPKREMALMRRFENMEELQKASLEEIGKAEGFNEKAAKEVYDFLHKEKQ